MWLLDRVDKKPLLEKSLSDLVVSKRVGLEEASEGEVRGLVSKMTLGFQA